MAKKFSKVSAVQPTKRVWYVLDVLEGTEDGPPELEVCHAGASNKRYMAAVLERGITNPRRRKRGIDTKTIVKAAESNIAEDIELVRDLYPEFIVTGFKRVVDDDGALVEFSIPNARDYLEQLPDWILERMRIYCENPINFIERGAPTAAEVKDAAGN